MVPIHYFFENISIHMGVDLGGGNIGMTEHLLHNPKVRASLKQVRSKGVSELMRREIPLDTGYQGRTPHNVVEGHTRDWLTLLADEDEITMLALQKFRARMFEIIGEGFFRMLTKGNQPFLATFTARSYDTEFKMEFLEAQSTELRCAQSRCVEQLHRGRSKIPICSSMCGRCGRNEVQDLLAAEHGW